MGSMAGPALSMAPLLSVVTAAVSGWCLSELPFVASLALSLAEDRVAFVCNFASPLSELTIDVVPSSFALDLVMAAVESVPPLAGPCSLLMQSATACFSYCRCQQHAQFHMKIVALLTSTAQPWELTTFAVVKYSYGQLK